MPKRKGISNVHSLTVEEPEFYPFMPSSGTGEAKRSIEDCPKCGERLWTFPWNRSREMVTCLNEYCLAWKQPVSGR